MNLMGPIRIIAGLICGLLAFLWFYVTITLKPSKIGMAYSFGFKIGQHAPWIVLAALSYFLLKKRK